MCVPSLQAQHLLCSASFLFFAQCQSEVPPYSLEKRTFKHPATRLFVDKARGIACTHHKCLLLSHTAEALIEQVKSTLYFCKPLQEFDSSIYTAALCVKKKHHCCAIALWTEFLLHRAIYGMHESRILLQVISCDITEPLLVLTKGLVLRLYRWFLHCGAEYLSQLSSGLLVPSQRKYASVHSLLACLLPTWRCIKPQFHPPSNTSKNTLLPGVYIRHATTATNSGNVNIHMTIMTAKVSRYCSCQEQM